MPQKRLFSKEIKELMAFWTLADNDKAYSSDLNHDKAKLSLILDPITNFLVQDDYSGVDQN